MLVHTFGSEIGKLVGTDVRNLDGSGVVDILEQVQVTLFVQT